MELRHMRYFIAVAEHLHFGHAADALATAQPSLSRQILQLEDELGVPLFRRTKKSVQLTDAGRAFLIDARRTVQSAEASMRHARENADGTRGELRIGFMGGAMLMSLPAIFRSFKRRFPDVMLTPHAMRHPDHVPALRSGSIDIVWTVTVDEPDIVSQSITTDVLWAALPADHPVAAKAEIDIADLGTEPILMLARNIAPVLYTETVRLCNMHGYHPAEILEVQEEPTLLGLVAAGFGVALVPHPWSAIRIPGLEFRRLRATFAYTDFLAWHHERYTPLVRSFVNTVVEIVGAQPGLTHPE